MDRISYLKGRIPRLRYLAGLVEDKDARRGFERLIRAREDELFDLESERVLTTLAENLQGRSSYADPAAWLAFYKKLVEGRTKELEARR